VTGDGLPNGGLPPFPVTYAVPVTTKPSETAGLNVGHCVFQLIGSVRSLWITPSVTLMWCVGDVARKSFWLVDLRTGAERQLTQLAPDVAVSDFDLSRDGSTVLFDRIQESSRIALIERGG
jgi:hypothetical protein